MLNPFEGSVVFIALGPAFPSFPLVELREKSFELLACSVLLVARQLATRSVVKSSLINGHIDLVSSTVSMHLVCTT